MSSSNPQRPTVASALPRFRCMGVFSMPPAEKEYSHSNSLEAFFSRMCLLLHVVPCKCPVPCCRFFGAVQYLEDCNSKLPASLAWCITSYHNLPFESHSVLAPQTIWGTIWLVSGWLDDGSLEQRSQIWNPSSHLGFQTPPKITPRKFT